MATENPYDNARKRPQLTVQTKHTSQPNVLARLQGLFPHSAAASSFPSSTPHEFAASEKPIRPSHSRHPSNVSKFLKVRLLTWNMHDSLPKGDLEELLGKVPYYTSPSSTPTSLPQFSLETDHPYHLIAIAGQECPSTSVIPNGLSAGFRYRDDRERDDRSRSSRQKEDPIKRRKSYDDVLHEGGSGSSWTSMLDDWLSHGGGAPRAASPYTSDISIPKPLSPRLTPKEPRRSPYQLLVKERLLGIYLAIYVHRDVRPFVQGISKSSVTAGLMGGRWGNKGGVGISVNVAGKTFCFINCHLAAQQDKANLQDRVHNFNKIKAELAVDDFLSNDDPRVMAEDLTDKFDYTFVFGDLNFRLDISRLHADWLISRQDYAQALAFDQLKNLMEHGRAFVGFNEAPINFPPTFKYDVLRTLKGSKRRVKSKSERAQRLTEVSERDFAVEADGEDCDKSSDDGEGEVASVASSVWTSTISRQALDREPEDNYFGAPQMARSHSSKLSSAALKAKTKWLSLLNPSSVPTSPRWLRSKSSLAELTPSKKARSSVEITTSDTKKQGEGSDGSPDFSVDVLKPPSALGRVSSTKSSAQSEDDDGMEKGVYDTSSKKRVPSWCDRILWKCTVEPDPEPLDPDDLDTHTRPRTRVGQFFANAFRPLASRSRRESLASVTPSTTPSSTPATTTDSPLPSPDLLETVIPFSRFVYPDSHPQRESLSASVEGALDETGLPRTASYESGEHHPSSVPPPTDSAARRRRAISVSVTDTAQGSQRDSSLSRWRFLPSFLTHSSSGSTSSDITGRSSTFPRPPRKGDVICLSYNALDDRGMRRLEGRSDHRPVIGSYAVYY